MKFCILAAGIGSRNNVLNGLHKGLLPIQNIPMISHVISKLESKQEIIVAVGHLSDQIISYLKFVHPERNIKFIHIDHFSGKGSGPGYSLLQCKEELQCPFVFVSNDTIFEEQLYFDEIQYNWLGYSTTKAGSDYRSLELDDDGNVISLNDKIKDSEDYSYIGICGIKDYKDFWQYMKEKKSLTMGESYGILRLLENHNFNSFKFTWYDTGNERSLSSAKQKLKSKHQPNILEKDNEAIWFANNKTINVSYDYITTHCYFFINWSSFHSNCL